MMKLFSIAALALAAAAGGASAQPYGGSRGQPTATLYERPGFQGRQTVIYGHAEDLPRQFNDIALSARFEGRWRVCEDSDYGGRCIDVQGDVADLNALGFAYKISSLQAYSDMADDDRGPRYGGGGYSGGYSGGSGGGYGGGYGGGRGDRDDGPTEGARNTFFPYPAFRGSDIAASPGAADRFCRANGLGPSSYFDTSARSNRAVDADGRFMPPGPVLRDVLCRR